MAGITQTIPSYTGGISEQPDQLKTPGQVRSVVNAIPDLTYGLYKRPGSKRIGTAPITNVQSGGSWFHYFRDEVEGSYIGQVAADGKIRMWSCNDGTEKQVHYYEAGGTISGGTNYDSGNSNHTSITTYLTPDPSTDSEDIQALTINDTTFLNNRSKTVAMAADLTTARPDRHFAYVEILRSENGRQYGLNIYRTSTTTNLNVATQLKLTDNTLGEQYGSGNCSGIGTQVFNVDRPVAAINVTAGGSSYDQTHMAPKFPTEPTAAEAYTRPGSAFQPSITFSGGGGTGAIADSALVNSSGAVTSIRLTHGGTGYTSAPTVAIGPSADGGGSGAAATATISGNRNLIFRVTVLGQQGKVGDSSSANDSWACSYNTDVILLHGGEGWTTGDSTTVTFTAADGGRFSERPNTGGSNTRYIYTDNPDFTVEIEDHEVIPVKGDIKAVRPVPTPFDADTAVTLDTIVGGIITEANGEENSYTIATGDVSTGNNRITITDHGLSTGAKLAYDSAGGTALGGLTHDTDYFIIVIDDNTIQLATTLANAEAGTAINLTGTGNSTQRLEAPIVATQIGSGVYLSCEAPFNIEVVDQDLMRVMQGTVNDVTKLPIQCKNGAIVKVANTRMSDEDDYYVKFNGINSTDGGGAWIECAEPGIKSTFDAATMPHILERHQDDGSGTLTGTANAIYFLVKQHLWKNRLVGDNVTNPIPTFVGEKINKVLFFRNRLVFLAGENVITSKPGTLTEPQFWNNSALTIGAIDPVDISCASKFPSDLFDGIETNSGLLCFSTNAQFLLAADDTVFNPDTAKLRALSNYNYNKVVPPIDTGLTVGWVDNSNKYSRFVEVGDVRREGEPSLMETSILVPTILPKDIDHVTNSRENNLIFFGKTDSDTVVGYRYFRQGEGVENMQAAWFKWKFNNPLKYHFCIEDEYYYLDTDNFLQKVNLMQADADPSIDQDNINYLLHLDNYTTVSSGSYSATTNLTTFTNQSDWIDQVTTPNGKLVIVDDDSGTTRTGRYAECTVINNDDFTVPGNWSSATLKIGYLYEYSVEFPRIYVQQIEGRSRVRSDVNSKLTVHRIKLNFGKIGLYETTLARVGKTDFTEVYESTDLDEYAVSDAPYLAEKIKDIPVYENNKNVGITLKSSHPAPATLRAMSWEGDWSAMHYRRS